MCAKTINYFFIINVCRTYIKLCYRHRPCLIHIRINSILQNLGHSSTWHAGTRLTGVPVLAACARESRGALAHKRGVALGEALAAVLAGRGGARVVLVAADAREALRAAAEEVALEVGAGAAGARARRAWVARLAVHACGVKNFGLKKKFLKKKNYG